MTSKTFALSSLQERQRRMATKAVWVTEENAKELQQRFDDDVDFPMITPGWFLVTAFGEDSRFYNLVSREKFKETYQPLGKLENGFIEVQLK